MSILITRALKNREMDMK